MEAPEKIFICDYGSELSYEWHSESEFESKCHNDIEYTRSDAFIEKLEKWLKGHILDYVQELNYGVGKSQPDYYTKHFIEDVKNYMKGE